MTLFASIFPQPCWQAIPPISEDAERRCRLILPYVIRLPWTGKWLGVRVGYESDGASLPTITWTLADASPFDPCCNILGGTHDPLYGGQLFDEIFGKENSKHMADKELFHIMDKNGQVAHEKAREFFIAVDEFGGGVWDAHTPESIAETRKYAGLFDTEAEAIAFANGVAA